MALIINGNTNPDFSKYEKREVSPYAFPILNILVLQVGHSPLVAGFPFFNVTAFVFFISLLLLHLTQYPVVIVAILIGGAISGMLLKFFNYKVTLELILIN